MLRNTLFRALSITTAAVVAMTLAVLNVPSTPLTYRYPATASHKASHDETTQVSEPIFIDRTLEAGLVAFHQQGGHVIQGIDESLGPGACALDFDGDGWMDLFVVGGSGETRFFGQGEWWHQTIGNRLYRNLQNGRFEDVTDRAGVKRSAWGMGCSAGDLDNDGDQDLFLTNLGENTLLENRGDGTFADVSAASGLIGSSWSTTATIADYDNDGRLDIFVANYIVYSKGAKTYEPDAGFKQLGSRRFDPTLYDGVPNQLYRNLGNLTFTDVTGSAGVASAGSRSLAATWLPLNDDLWPDLLVANDAGVPNAAYLNQGDGSFKDVTSSLLLKTGEPTYSLAVGDINNDGRNDLVMGTGSRYLTRVLFRTDAPTETIAQGSRARHGFADRSLDIGVGLENYAAQSNWGIGLFDFNNDGFLDLFCANGLLIPDPDAPKITLGQPNVLWLNHSGHEFVESISLRSEHAMDALSSRGVVIADFDNDGDLDIYVAQNNNLGQLLYNQSPASHWLGIRLIGQAANRDAIGSSLTLRTQGKTYVRSHFGAAGFLSRNDPRIRFGIGEHPAIDELTVNWPDGTRSSFSEVPIDRYIEIAQGQSEFRELRYPRESEQPKIKLTIGADVPEYRAKYLDWALRNEPVAGPTDELVAGLEDPDPRVRRIAIAFAGKEHTTFILGALIRRLTDSEPAVRIAAIEALGRFEADAAVRWLIRATHDSVPQVRCAAMALFEHYFREEEAVVVQKHLAVSHLISALTDDNPIVRKCTAQALGESDSYRAIQPLIAMLRDNDMQTRAEAARSLGLLRHRMAIPSLHKRAIDHDEYPGVRTSALIALHRLSTQAFEAAFQALMAGLDLLEPSQSIGRDLDMIHQLLADPEGELLASKYPIRQNIAVWYKRHAQAIDQMPIQASTALAQHTLDILRTGPSILVTPILQELGRHKDSRIRGQAIATLIGLLPGKASELAAKALDDSDIDVGKHVLQSLLTTDIKVPIKLLFEELHTDELQLDIVKVLSRYPSKEAQKALVGFIVDERVALETRIAALDSLMAHGVRSPSIPRGIFSDENESIRALALQIWIARQGSGRITEVPPDFLINGLRDDSKIVRTAAVDVLLARTEAWAIDLAVPILLNPQETISIRKAVLETLAMRDTALARAALQRLARWRHDPLAVEAVKRLRGPSLDALENRLWSWFDSDHATSALKFAAAEALYPRYPDRVVERLRRTSHHR